MPPLLVTDTHPFVWYLTSQFNKMPLKVKKAFDDAVSGKCAMYIPVIVLWEFSLLVKAGTVRLSVPLEDYVRERFFSKAISVLDLQTEDVLLSHELSFTRDPFDSLIVAMALRVDCPLITVDELILDSNPCETFWH